MHDAVADPILPGKWPAEGIDSGGHALLPNSRLAIQQFQLWFSSAWRQAQAHQHEVQEVFPVGELEVAQEGADVIKERHAGTKFLA